MSKLRVLATRVETTDLLKYYALDASLALLIVGGLVFWMLAFLH